MRLLNARTIRLECFDDESKIPEYAILSHTWGDVEVTFRDLTELSPEQLTLKEGYDKVEKCCTKTLEWGLEYVWMDTCCIDQSSSAELSEAINSMYQWYQQSSVCYAYLYDVCSAEEDFMPDKIIDYSPFHTARWFTRGWCLQELLAPRNMHFYNKDWAYIGSKYHLKTPISRVTGIDEYSMFIPDLSVLSVAHRMSWAAHRQTKRPEDTAYCLLGIFNINMPLLYGEGELRAFGRLQEEIMRRTEDPSIFAWKGIMTDFGNDMVGFLAPHPSAFRYEKVGLSELPKRVEPLSITGRGIRAEVPLIRQGSAENYLAVIGCSSSESPKSYYAIPVTPLQKLGDTYRRRGPDLETVSPGEAGKADVKTIFLLRHSKPTHLEDKDTIQVWFSLVEMRDCIYRIKGAYPAPKWNFGRRVFAFSPPDWERSLGRLSAAVALMNAERKGFVLIINLELISKALPTLWLTEFKEPVFEDPSQFNLEDELRSIVDINKKHLHHESKLDLGRHTVTASVEQNVVEKQELYEVRITIG